MADMGLQLEPISQGLETYGPWHFGEIRCHQDPRAELEAALLQTAAIPGLSDTLREITKATRADRHGAAHPEVMLSLSRPPRLGSRSPGPSIASPVAASTTKTGHSLAPPAVHSSLRFVQIAPSNRGVVTFPLRPPPPPPPRPCLKRRRQASDVDGYNTAALGCKKRRLLRHLITSRLSQPFSLPATHILNREAVATGDKRFLKLAAIMSARRLHSAVPAAPAAAPPAPQQPSPSTWLRRAAVLNRLRARVCAEVAERSHVQSADVAVRTVFQAQQQQQQGPPNGTTASLGGRYLVQSTGHHSVTTPCAHPQPLLPSPAGAAGLAMPGHRPGTSIIHAAAVSATYPSTSSSPTIPLLSSPSTTSPSVTCLRIPSPQLRPLRSPELRVTRPPVPLPLDLRSLDDDDDDECGVAFPTSAHESRYGYDDDDDDGEDGVGGGEVYADFSVIFGGGGGGEKGNGEDEEDGAGGGAGEHFEDYMDDLDGIPWCARC